MPDLPNVTETDVAHLIPEASEITRAGSGGQKLVFRGVIGGQQYAFKFAKVPVDDLDDADTCDFLATDIAVRAQREIETMRECASPHLVRLGPIGLKFDKLGDQNILYFSEEFVAGRDLRVILQASGPLPVGEVVKLGLHIADAISALWEKRKVHRDIKPANIMRREGDGAYLLLDAGLIFDIAGESVSHAPVGTPAYFSPEQFDFTNRRTVLDFRSDLFSLGVTMYQVGTGTHPFWERGDSSAALCNKICTYVPIRPTELIDQFPKELSDIIMRLLGKKPHLRYRHCQQLVDALERV